MKYRGIVFDFDGVIVDSEVHWAKIESSYLKRHIPRWTPDNYVSLIGMSLIDAHTYLRDKHGFGLGFEKYQKDYEDMARKLYSDLCNVTPGLKSLLKSLYRHSAKTAIASSSKRAWIETTLKSKGIDTYFNKVVSSDDDSVIVGKPAPDIYLEAARTLGERPVALIAIEDSRTGVASAKAAGLFCIGFRNGHNGEQDLSSADLVFEGFRTANINALMEYLK